MSKALHLSLKEINNYVYRKHLLISVCCCRWLWKHENLNLGAFIYLLTNFISIFCVSNILYSTSFVLSISSSLSKIISLSIESECYTKKRISKIQHAFLSLTKFFLFFHSFHSIADDLTNCSKIISRRHSVYFVRKKTTEIKENFVFFEKIYRVWRFFSIVNRLLVLCLIRVSIFNRNGTIYYQMLSKLIICCDRTLIRYHNKEI